MNKQEFLDILRSQLDWLNDAEKQKTVQFYSEIIDDRVEDGMSEQEAVESLGHIDDIVSEIKKDMPDEPVSPAVPAPAAPQKSGKALWIVLAICGSPFWVPLAAAALVILLAVYFCIIAAAASLFVIVPCLTAVSVAAMLSGLISCVTGNALTGTALIGASLSLAGLALMLARPMWWLCRELIMLLPKSVMYIINLFRKDRRTAQ